MDLGRSETSNSWLLFAGIARLTYVLVPHGPPSGHPADWVASFIGPEIIKNRRIGHEGSLDNLVRHFEKQRAR